jgi:molecular chaperone GrpE (heat shock protein)
VRTNTGQPVDPAFSGQAINAAVDKVANQVNQLQQGLNNLTRRCDQIDNQITVSDSQYRDAAHGVAQAANWIGQAQLKAGMAANGGELSESERAAAIAMLERYREPLRSNANRVEPIAHALRELSEKLQYRSHSSPQVVDRIQNLYHGIARFDRQISQVTTELESLHRGSFAERSARLQADQDRLFDQVNNGSLSVGQMVQQSRSLIERHFPAEQKSRTDQNLSLEEQEANLKKGIDEAADYLMDWYNNLFQLQAQLGQIHGSQADAETAGELAKIQELAREALNRFDIQPEAIQIGQTSFDRRLHEATLVRQAPQYPVNTVIDVQKCGFRRMTTGEVLRRPEVVVAGTAA